MGYVQAVQVNQTNTTNNAQIKATARVSGTQTAITQVEFIGPGTFTIEVQAKTRGGGGSGWARIAVASHTDLDANGSILIEHGDFDRLRHRITANTGTVNTWIQRA